MTVDYRKASDIPDDVFVAGVETARRLSYERLGDPVPDQGGWASKWDLACVLGGVPERLGTREAVEPVPGVPEKVLLAKARRLIKRGVIDGCTCGCRGDFSIVVPT